VFSAPIAVSLSLWRAASTKTRSWRSASTQHRYTTIYGLDLAQIVSYDASSFPANTTIKLSNPARYVLRGCSYLTRRQRSAMVRQTYSER
jgi:hypothetical protein